MARPKKTLKAKEPIKLRSRVIANGNRTLYLDKYVKGVREYEYLKLYLVPVTDGASKLANENTLKAANAIKAQRILELTNGVGGIKTGGIKGKILLTDWFDVVAKQKKEKGYTEETQLHYVSTKRHIANYVGGRKIRLCDVDKDFILGFIGYLSSAKSLKNTINSQPLGKKSALLYFQTLTTTLNEAKRQGYILNNPVNDISVDDKRPIIGKSKPREYLTIDEVKRLQNVVCVNNDTLRAFMFSCFTGLRLSDIRALQWSDIVSTDTGKEIVITMKKTKEVVYVPLSSVAASWLPTRKGNDRVFRLPYKSSINRRLKKWTDSVGITKNISFHTARHTFATLCLTSGADLYTTSKLLGHTNIKTTQIYAEIINQKKVDAVNLISKNFE